MKNPNRKADIRRAADGLENRADTLIIVDSKSGTAAKYAEWISEALGTDMVPATRKYLGYSSIYRNVIYIGGVRDCELNHLGLLQQNYENFNLGGRHIIVVAVGVGNPTDTYLKKIISYNYLEKFGDSFYYLPGKVDVENRKSMEEALISKCVKNLPKLYAKEDAEIIFNRLVNGYDGVNRGNIQPIVDEILAIRNNNATVKATVEDDNTPESEATNADSAEDGEEE